MHKAVLIVGAGKIGSLIACLLAEAADYKVYLADVDFNNDDAEHVLAHLPVQKVALDVRDQLAINSFLQATPVIAIISSLPYYLNPTLAEAAKKNNLHYFDLTEDTKVKSLVAELAKNSKKAFVTQCGLAPGFVSIVAHSIMERFEKLDTVALRVGALPQSTNNRLYYALTWSTEGLINQYANPCPALENGQLRNLEPLADKEPLFINGVSYEAFNTSGGIGSLAESYSGKVQTMNYKTIRYPGHCQQMRFLMRDLKLNANKDLMKQILEGALAKTYKDVVIIYISVIGLQRGQSLEENYVKKMYPQVIASRTWSAIQVSTASSLCAIVDNVLADEDAYHGLVLQEQFSLADFLGNRFARYYAAV